MAVPDVSMAGREPPHIGPVAHGFAALGDAAERAVSQLTSVAADAVQTPSRLSQAASAKPPRSSRPMVELARFGR